jgi:hypothetical protein
MSPEYGSYISSVKKLDVYVPTSSVTVTAADVETTVAVCVLASETNVAVAVCALTAVTTDCDVVLGVTVIVQFDVLRTADTLVRNVIDLLSSVTLPM